MTDIYHPSNKSKKVHINRQSRLQGDQCQRQKGHSVVRKDQLTRKTKNLKVYTPDKRASKHTMQKFTKGRTRWYAVIPATYMVEIWP
jgi:hypothetical protein